MTYYVNIKAAKGKAAAMQPAIEELAKENDMFRLQSYKEILEQWKGSMQMMTGAGYAIMLVLAIVGIMNLINTTIDSILSRKKNWV